MSLKILVIRFSSMGDIVLTTPVLRALRAKYPNAVIHYLTKEKFREAIELHPVPDKIWYLKNSLAEIILQLQQERFDYIIDLHASLRSFLVRFQLMGKVYVFPKSVFRRWKFIRLGMGRPDTRHIVVRYLEAVKKLGVSDDQQGLDFILEPDILEKVSAQSKEIFGEQIPMAIVLAATWHTKKWPVNYYIRFLLNSKQPFVLLGGEGEKMEALEIMNQVPDGLNLTGRCSLQESAAWLQVSKFVISHDTGLMHIASALKKNIFVLWGNTAPQLGMYPWMTEHYNLEVRGLSCRPCTHLGHRECPKGHFACMINLSPEKLTDMVNYHFGSNDISTV